MAAPLHRTCVQSISTLGAYGIRLSGVDRAGELLVEVEPEAPAYAIESELGIAPASDEHVDDERARLRLRSGGEIVVDRRARRATFRVPHPVRPDELVHPYLAPAAAVIARWMGREGMHAGAFAADGRALGVVGARAAGKSSTLAQLAGIGAGVLCDDLLVVDGRRPLAGPRSIDLRADAARRLGVGEPIGMTGGRERWRLLVGTAAPAAVLCGWVFLAWGERLEARRLPGPERIARLAAQRSLRLPPARPDALLELASLPAWELSRPQRWESLPAATDLLLELATARPTEAA